MIELQKEKLKKWVVSQKDTLDKITYLACRDFKDKNEKESNFYHDLYGTYDESYLLSKDEDLCYDRYTTPLIYTAWYHPRRINTFLLFFIDSLISFSGKKIQLFDLGAGTGAVQWAVLFVAHGLKKNDLKPPSISIVNIDTSPFMLSFNRDYLWKYFIKKFNLDGLEYSIEYSTNS